jgi:large conductance mechanosensitive channel
VAERKGVLAGFKEFILRGNVVDLAVAVIIAAAFGAVVTAFVDDILTPLIAAIVGKPNFADLFFTINKSQFLYGKVINAIITFLGVAAAVYFFVIVPLNHMAERRARGVAEPESDLRPCPACLTEIPKLATRCSACTSDVGAVA